MVLQVKICSRKVSLNRKSLYLYIKLKGHIYYERLNIFISKNEEGTEDYKRKLMKADNYRLLRIHEISNNPNLIYEEELTRTTPPDFLYVGRIERNCGCYRFLQEEIIHYIEDNLYQKTITFSDFVQFAKDIEDKFCFHSHGTYENLSSVLRINPTSYCGVKPFISISIVRNNRKALECFAFPCNEIIKPKETEIELDETIRVKVVATQTQKSKRSYKTYIMKDDSLGYVKIGKSVNVLVRERTLEAQNPKISLFAVCQKDVETELHRKYKAYRVRGEWFKLTKKEIDKIVNDYDFILKEY